MFIIHSFCESLRDNFTEVGKTPCVFSWNFGIMYLRELFYTGVKPLSTNQVY